MEFSDILHKNEFTGSILITQMKGKLQWKYQTLTNSVSGYKFCYKCLDQSSKVEREMWRLRSHSKIRRSWIVFYKGVCVWVFGGCKRPARWYHSLTLFAFWVLNFNVVAPIHSPLSLLLVRGRWKVDYLCLTVSCSRLSEPFALLPTLPLLLSGFMLSSGGYCLETFLLQGHY